ncbi:Proteasome subunit beta type-3 [Saguinus oedipus]|uniref:Proteasome subunit beta n=1 Tax=Saguinus oedipus TaxID=9490 RepID=A0ABQ9VSF6_SAGOE|nr:Proteasome subunit beta type-3 [Saguinus oedipus]
MSYNGGAVMAMKGKNCVAIAADRRFGIQAQMVTTDFQKIFPMGDRLYIGLAGLATDVQTVAQRLKFRLNLYELKEGRQIKPYTLMSMVANLLYEKRAITEDHALGNDCHPPVIAGLDPKTFKPFICSLDLIGCPMVTDDFVVSGTCAEQMYGMCESLWEPNMIAVCWEEEERRPGGRRNSPCKGTGGPGMFSDWRELTLTGMWVKRGNNAGD